MYTRKEKILFCIVIILSFALVGTIYINSQKTVEIMIEEDEPEEEKNVGDDENKLEEVSLIGVHISGAVKTPGFIWIKDGTRLGEALEYVGGALADADLDAVNLSQKLSDEEKVYIPRIGESTELIEYYSKDNYTVEGNNVLKTSKININTASLEELDTLPGVGETYARRIIEYREANGPFNSIEEIKNVSGIGEKRYETIKDLIKVK